MPSNNDVYSALEEILLTKLKEKTENLSAEGQLGFKVSDSTKYALPKKFREDLKSSCSYFNSETVNFLTNNDNEELSKVCDKIVNAPGLISPIRNGFNQYFRRESRDMALATIISPIVGIFYGAARTLRSIPYGVSRYNTIVPDEIIGSSNDTKEHMAALKEIQKDANAVGNNSLADLVSKFIETDQKKLNRNGRLILPPFDEDQMPRLVACYFEREVNKALKLSKEEANKQNAQDSNPEIKKNNWTDRVQSSEQLNEGEQNTR